jgi:hypothetical protein
VPSDKDGARILAAPGACLIVNYDKRPPSAAKKFAYPPDFSTVGGQNQE